jgi:predicted RND superfamily exporter protein
MEEIETKILSVNLLTPSDLPAAYKSQYVSKDENKFLITIYPDFDIWDELGKEKCDIFLSDITNISPDVTGTPIFMLDLHNAVADELLMMGSILIGILLIILFIHFRSLKYTLLAFLPLSFTMVYMIGIMKLINLQFNMINFLVVLLIIGIGLDDGVHILHHYKEGERNIKKLFSRIGRAILLTTVTTVFGFGSLSFSSYTGIAGTGVILAIGVSLALVFTILALPIFLRHEKKKQKK